MKEKLIRLMKLAPLVGVVVTLCAAQAHAGAVVASEATDVARWWLTQEINGDWTKLKSEDREAMRQQLALSSTVSLTRDGVNYVVSSVGKSQASAHIVTMPGGGYVVVSGDDRMEPVLAFDLRGTFDWDNLQNTGGRTIMTRMLTSWDRHLAAASAGADPVNPRWTALRQSLQAVARDLAEVADYSPQPLAVLLELTTAIWSQGGFYNDTLQTHVGNNNSVPVGCTATAMAILMRYFEWPGTGTGANSYWDVCDSVNYWHSVTLGAGYSWNSMPLTSLTSANSQVADLMYHCGVMVGMNYEVGGSGAWLSATVMNSNFRYRGTTEKTSSHEAPIEDCVKSLVPVVLSSSSHTMVCDGYRDTSAPDFYHINAGHDGGGDGWYTMTTLPAGDTTIDRSYPYGTPNNYAYVDVYHTGTENGDLDTPYDTVSEGVSGVTSSGHLWIEGGTYNEAITIGADGKRCTMRAYRGNAVIE